MALGECRAQEIRGSHVAFGDLYETTVIAKPILVAEPHCESITWSGAALYHSVGLTN